MTNHDTWYQAWFDTEYYHILYQHRDDHEAQAFIRKLVEELQPSPEARILDLACGRGRHAIFLHELGYKVTGIDLSQASIDYARQYSEPGLDFEVGDMRQCLGVDRFDLLFNLFTSFGYFDQRADNLRALARMRECLKPGGRLVLDFMNVNKVRLGLVKEEVRQVEDIEFHIERFLRDEQVIKQISFEDKGKTHRYEEKVQLLSLADFEQMFAEVGLQINQVYGDFDLSAFDPRNSERLILFAHNP